MDAKLGFVRYNKDDLMKNTNDLFKKQFGDDIDLSDGSNVGALANIFTDVRDNIDQEEQAVHDSFLLLKSTGQDLDDIASEEGVYRKIATNSTVQLLITAYINPDSPTVITTDDGEYSTADGQIFRITDDVTINQQATGANGQPMADDDGNPLGQATITATSEDTGAIQNVAPNSIINPEQAIDGFVSVTNPQKAVGGLDVETDNAFKTRALANRLAKVNGTQDGITNALRNLDDVRDARVISNRSLDADKYGNPGKSTHAYVLGGSPDEIADTLYHTCDATTNYIGKISGTAHSIDGSDITINYDNAPQALVYVKINVKTDPTTFDVDYGTQQIKNAINAYFDALTMGDEVNFTKLYAPIYNVNGVVDAAIELGKDSADNVKPNQSITVGDMEVPVVAHIDVGVE